MKNVCTCGADGPSVHLDGVDLPGAGYDAALVLEALHDLPSPPAGAR